MSAVLRVQISALYVTTGLFISKVLSLYYQVGRRDALGGRDSVVDIGTISRVGLPKNCG